MTRLLSRLLSARAAALLLLLALLLPAPVEALDPPRPFARIRPREITAVVVQRGQGEDERWYVAPGVAMELVKTVANIEAIKHMPGDWIQEQTWDWRTNTPMKYTPLVWRVGVLEWSPLWVRERNTWLSCYEVNAAWVYHCRATQGGPDRYLGWHTNSMTVDRDYLDALLKDTLAKYPGRARTIGNEPKAIKETIMDLQFYDISIDYLNILISVAVVVLPTLIGLALIFLGGAGAVASWKRLSVLVRPLVDEPTDDIIVALAKALKLDPEQVLKLFKALLAEGDVPEPEVSVGPNGAVT